MKKMIIAALAGLALLAAPAAEAAVSTLEQTLGRTVIARPVLEGLRDEAGQKVEQDLDKIVCELTEVVAKHEGAAGRLDYFVVSDTDMYTSLLLETSWTDSKGRETKHLQSAFYEKLRGNRVRLEDMLERQLKPAQLEPLKEHFGVRTLDGSLTLTAADCGKIKRVPEDFVVDEAGKLYLLFQPLELTDKTAEPVLLLIANP